MNILFVIILASGIMTLLFTNPELCVTAMLTGSHDAVALSINLLAIYSLWLGLFYIIEKIGVADKLAILLRPAINFLFPGERLEARSYITMNISANLLGLGNASTPMAINAIGAMNSDNDTKASQNMIMLVVISCTSLQLLPTTVIGLRASLNSSSPSGFLIPCMIATTASTIIGIALVKILGAITKKITTKTRNHRRTK